MTWRAFILLALSVVAVSCAPQRSAESLRTYGFHDISTTGWDPFSCSSEYAFATGFTAKNSNNQPIEGTVCCGLLKSCTVRTR